MPLNITALVYKFLNDNHLPDDEFYDVVIFPYLKAVQDYFQMNRHNAIHSQRLPATECVCVVYDHFRSQARRKRNAEILSIHIGLYPDGVPGWRNCCRRRMI